MISESDTDRIYPGSGEHGLPTSPRIFKAQPIGAKREKGERLAYVDIKGGILRVRDNIRRY